MVSKEEILGLIKFLRTPLEFYKDPVYSQDEKEDIKKMEELAFQFYNDLKKDGYITPIITERDRKEDERIVRFTKTTICMHACK